MEEKKTILIIDDEEVVRRLLKTALERLGGYAVLTAVDGVDGVEVFTAHQEEISLVLSDINMPRQDGRWATQQIRKIRSEVVIVLMSTLEEEEEEGVPFILKPFKVLVFLETIKNLLK